MSTQNVLLRRPNIYCFQTVKDGQYRTVGICCYLKDPTHELADWHQDAAVTLNRLFGYDENRFLPTAKGKVSFIVAGKRAVSPECKCFQVKELEGQEVFCGNSVAASAALIQKFRHKSEFNLEYVCGDVRINVGASVSRHDQLLRVEQEWQADCPIDAIEATDSKEIRFDFFNDYLVVKGPVDDLEGLFKREILDRDLNSKLAVIFPGTSMPVVHFYNCNGLHGAAPQTGLATLAILRHKVDWIGEILSGSEIRTQSSEELLPEIEVADSAIRFIMPAVDVRFVRKF